MTTAVRSVCLVHEQGSVERSYAAVTLDNDAAIETNEPITMALVSRILRLQCNVAYALRHLENWCECVTKEECERRTREALKTESR